MRLVSTRTGAGMCAAVLLATTVPAHAGVDEKLLDMLRANGSISANQYAELKGELVKEQEAQQQVAAQQVKKEDLNAFQQKVAWASKTQIKGDVRLRYENQDTEGAASNSGKEQDRQRVRARFGVYSEINPQVDAGIRLATGSSNDARSTNENLDNYFVKKSSWIDLAYLDWHPTALPNLHLIGGKMAQPWVSMGDVIWDGDINPEGATATYKHALGGKSELFGSVGYYNLKDNVDGEGVEFRHDLRMYAGQLGGRFGVTDNLKLTVGGSVYGFDGDEDTTALSINGNSANEQFKLYEGFAQVDISGLAIPLALYGQYVKNADASDDHDVAWLTGAKTKVFDKWSLDYNYRDVQRNAVVGAFTDSDFGGGFAGARGHKFKVSYDIDKNFALGATYFMAESDTYFAAKRDADVDTLQVDLEAKF
ncbi:putative porin [Pseudomonas sp. RIT-PI-S]|uniref:putative porin n=1 Tax=Pseudomonas sp. RIT-PI-S TaxID=3035295 RepID=UPI0021D857E9|nr:putative porin [Pseudomonas sp. RIT-PI-S]